MKGSAAVDRDWSKLRKWIIKRRLEGRHVTAICSEAQIDRKMFYRWWNRYQALGWDGLEEKPRGRPKSSFVERSLRNKVIKLRERYEWDPTRLQAPSNAKAAS